ncbi:MAG TPA: hypothetical protein VMT16_05965 [Thermoanaerobaculia bacterium]|nr:hypothetical protein [Thermoanaerobaculia bacterium]
MARASADGERTVVLPRGAAQAATLVRAVEEVDRRGELLALDERRRATEEARQGVAEAPRKWLGRRAERLVGALARERPQVRRLLALTDLGRGLLWPTVVLALALGLASNALGPERRIHVLAAPVLGLVLWNVLVVLLGLVHRAVPLLPSGLRFERPRLLAWLERWAGRWVERQGAADDPQAELWRAASRRYLALWLPAQAPLAAARVRRLLHAGAAAMVVGAVAGMYLRGLVLEYRVSWESTFLGGAAVDRILAVVLAPAAALMGRDVPSAAAAGPQGLPAAEWIHLWALTAALFVLLPRGILIAAETLHVLRRERRTPIVVPEAYLRRLAATTEARVGRVDVVPYSYHPSPQAAEALRGLLHDLFGARAEVRLRPAAEYGAAAAELHGGGSLVVLFSLAQTPEVEVHGELLAACRDGLADGQALLAVVDAAAYRRRLGEADPGAARLAERRRSWDRVVQAVGLVATHLDLDDAAPDASLAALERGAWPGGVLGGRR